MGPVTRIRVKRRKLGRRSSGRAGGTVKKLRAMESYKKYYHLFLLFFSNNVHIKNNNVEIMKNYSELSLWVRALPSPLPPILKVSGH